MACCDALDGDLKSSLTYLAKSIRNSFDDLALLETDSDLSNLRGGKGFEAAVTLVEIAKKLRHELKSESSEDKATELAKLRALSRIVSEDGELASDYAMAAHMAGEYENSLEAWTRQAKLGFKVPTAMYNRGCAYSLLGKHEAAVECLLEAGRIGMSDARLTMLVLNEAGQLVKEIVTAKPLAKSGATVGGTTDTSLRKTQGAHQIDKVAVKEMLKERRSEMLRLKKELEAKSKELESLERKIEQAHLEQR
jgi:tetratricopeptide (TPR) repeat protein